MADSTDFTLVDLPDVTLVNVMSYLKLGDRFSFMQTCRRMRDIFQHPSLWYHLHVRVRGNYKEKRDLDRYFQMIESVGRYCQELEFHYDGLFTKMDDDVRKFIHDLSEKCRLETLVVSIEYANTKDLQRENFIGPALKEDIDCLCSIVGHCHRLTSFCIRSWPVFNHTDPSRNEILEVLCDNAKLVKLEKLHLFWPDRSATTWASVRTNQTSEYALKVVDHFKMLTHLSLMSNVLSEKLVKSLASPNRSPLESVRIMVIYKAEMMAVPRISTDAWSRLAGSSPGLKLEVVFSSRVPSEQMFTLLVPSLPLSTLHFMKYSRCGADDLDRVVELYNNTFEKLVDETDSSLPKQLLKLVHVCPKLHTLIYHGKLSCKTIIDLAKSKGKDWYRFVINGNSVDADDTSELGNDGDENQVIRRNAQGEYYSVDMHHWADTDQSLQRKSETLGAMILEVSKALGYEWEPFY